MTNRIRLLRESCDMKQIDLAKRLNVSQGTLSNWERGEYDIDNDNLIRIAELFNVSTDCVLGRDNAEIVPQKEKPADIGELDKNTQYLVNAYRELPEDDRQLLVAQAELLLKRRTQ